MSLSLNNSNDTICNTFRIIENGVFVGLDRKITSGTLEINNLISDSTFRNLNTFK